MPALKARGFRDEDVGALRTYLANNDPRHDDLREGRQLVETFAKRLQGQRKAGQKLNLQEVLAYRYQKSSLRAEARAAAGPSASWMRSTSSGSASWCRFSTSSSPR